MTILGKWGTHGEVISNKRDPSIKEIRGNPFRPAVEGPKLQAFFFFFFLVDDAVLFAEASVEQAKTY